MLSDMADAAGWSRPLLGFLVAAGEAALRGSPPPSMLRALYGGLNAYRGRYRLVRGSRCVMHRAVAPGLWTARAVDRAGLPIGCVRAERALRLERIAACGGSSWGVGSGRVVGSGRSRQSHSDRGAGLVDRHIRRHGQTAAL